MKLMDQWERRWGKWAIQHMTRWIVLFNALGYIIIHSNPQAQSFLLLDAGQVVQGEVWRLATYLFIPPSLSPIWIIFALYFIYLVGEGLEEEWGAFKLNVYYLVGMAATTLIAFFLQPGAVDNTYLNTSLFLAFATIYPEYVIYLFFIIPVKVKWLAWFTTGLLAVNVFVGTIPTKLAVLVSVANYFLFFGKAIWENIALRRQTSQLRARFREASHAEGEESFHRCVRCGRTELSHPDLVFRVAGDGEEYCVEHLAKNKG